MRNLKNSVQLLGRLGAKPEIFTFENGNKKASFSLATNETYKNQKGEKVENTEWHNVVMFNGMANVAEEYMDKGDQVLLEGQLKNREYTDKEGNKKYITEIVVNDFHMLGGKKK
jgi:single-strand DNA-binding protein